MRDIDAEAEFEQPEEGILVATTNANPVSIGSRVAFSRRVGTFVEDGRLEGDALDQLRRGTYRVRVFGDAQGREEEREVISSIAERVEGKVSLENPDLEASVYLDGGRTFLAITNPGSMKQGWSKRRPRSRAFFHPSAIFPKLSRALVNFSGIQPGEAFLDPFCGTGSLLIEAALVGADCLGIDKARKMVRGARRNALKYAQPWLGLVRADSRSLPIREVGAVATDIPYGRASSAGGLESEEILRSLIQEAEGVLPRGKKLVVMHPKSLEVSPILREEKTETACFCIEQELDIYIHRKLTRTITVLRREIAS